MPRDKGDHCKPPANEGAVLKSFEKLGGDCSGCRSRHRHTIDGTDRYTPLRQNPNRHDISGGRAAMALQVPARKVLWVSHRLRRGGFSMRGIACKRILLAVLTSLWVTGIASAQPLASNDYLHECAECHGADGKGAAAEKRDGARLRFHRSNPDQQTQRRSVSSPESVRRDRRPQSNRGSLSVATCLDGARVIASMDRK